jgi:DNA-directed RNA polymerase subunit RPC12/RpoP
MKKRYCCPVCGKRFPLYSFFTTTPTFRCKKCNRDIVVTKRPFTFQQSFFIGFIPVIISGLMLKDMGFPFVKTISICLLIGIVVLFFVCLINYFFSEFEIQT